MADLDPRDAVVTDEHLADVVDDTIQTLIEGAKFLVCCPTCGSEWALGIDPEAEAGLSNEYGNRAIDALFRKLARDMPELMCGLCILTGHQEASDG